MNYHPKKTFHLHAKDLNAKKEILTVVTEVTGNVIVSLTLIEVKCVSVPRTLIVKSDHLSAKLSVVLRETEMAIVKELIVEEVIVTVTGAVEEVIGIGTGDSIDPNQIVDLIGIVVIGHRDLVQKQQGLQMMDHGDVVVHQKGVIVATEGIVEEIVEGIVETVETAGTTGEHLEVEVVGEIEMVHLSAGKVVSVSGILEVAVVVVVLVNQKVMMITGVAQAKKRNLPDRVLSSNCSKRKL